MLDNDTLSPGPLAGVQVPNAVVPGSIASAILNFLRILAALTVVSLHWLSFRGFTESAFFRQHPLLFLPFKAYILWSIMGYQFVMAFFVLSGYFIGTSVLKAIQSGRWSWRYYLIQRLTRLWIVLLPALVLTIVWHYLQILLFGVGYGTSRAFSVSSFLANMAFLQGSHGPDFGANVPLWSLAYEFWCYLLFPCVMLAIAAKTWRARMLYGMITVGIGVLVGPRILEYFFVWLLGVAIAVTPPVTTRSRGWRGVWLAGAIVVALGLMGLPHVVPMLAPGSIIPDFGTGLGFAQLLYMLISHYNRQHPASRWMTGLASALAGFSYTLYLTHYPILHFLRAWIASPWWPWPERSSFLLTGPCVLMALGVYAWGIAQLTEARTDTVRRWVTRQLNTIYQGR